MAATTKTWYTSSAGSVAVDKLTLQVLTVQNRLLRLSRFGGETENMTATQGGWRPWTPYSGPTHRGCRVVDLTAYNWRNRLIVGDLLGAIYAHRSPAEGDWPEHGHQMTNSDDLGCGDPYMQAQIREIMAGGDGLKGGLPDRDADLRSGLWPVPIFKGRTGQLRANQLTHLYDGPSSTRTQVSRAPSGTVVNAIMEVRNIHGNTWFVTDQGWFGFAGKWHRS